MTTLADRTRIIQKTIVPRTRKTGTARSPGA